MSTGTPDEILGTSRKLPTAFADITNHAGVIIASGSASGNIDSEADVMDRKVTSKGQGGAKVTKSAKGPEGKKGVTAKPGGMSGSSSSKTASSTAAVGSKKKGSKDSSGSSSGFKRSEMDQPPSIDLIAKFAAERDR